MVDVTEDFLVKAKSYLGEEGKRVRNYFCCGLQDFSPEPHSYDVIWIQWVIGERPGPSAASLLVCSAEAGPPWALGAGLLRQAGQQGFLSPPLSPGLRLEGSSASVFWFNSIPTAAHSGAVCC